mgnify:CR=1 FL=1
MITSSYLTTGEIAVEIGRTSARVRQLVHGQCTCEPLPADRWDAPGCAGVGLLMTAASSFAAWLPLWEAHPARW